MYCSTDPPSPLPADNVISELAAGLIEAGERTGKSMDVASHIAGRLRDVGKLQPHPLYHVKTPLVEFVLSSRLSTSSGVGRWVRGD